MGLRHGEDCPPSPETRPIVPVEWLMGHSAAALMVTENDTCLMQHRDDVPWIWYPDHWNLFGGGVAAHEMPAEALLRELMEELEFVPDDIRYFTQVAFDMGEFDGGIRCRHIFEVPIRESDIGRMVLREGAGMRLFDRAGLACEEKVVPCDLFAVQLYQSRGLKLAPQETRPNRGAG